MFSSQYYRKRDDRVLIEPGRDVLTEGVFGSSSVANAGYVPIESAASCNEHVLQVTG